MKILLVAVNAKYIHSCPAVYSLKGYADKYKKNNEEIEIAEYTINDRYNDILADIVLKNADVVAFSTYIWNVDRVQKLISDLRKIRENEVMIWAGGPECTNSPEKFLLDGQCDLCISGEGEEIFLELCDTAENCKSIEEFEICVRKIRGLSLFENQSGIPALRAHRPSCNRTSHRASGNGYPWSC